MDQDRFTKTETLRRLRQLAKLVRQQEDLPSNAPVEVGFRLEQRWLDNPPATQQCANLASYPQGDDLDKFESLDDAARTPDLKTPGAVVHLYISRQEGTHLELVEVVVCWLGNSSHDPRVIDSRFVSYAE